MNDFEKEIIKKYSKCTELQKCEDVIFIYPESLRDPAEMAEKLQSALNYLKDITNLDIKKHFKNRVIIGYRHLSDENGTKVNPIWDPINNRVSLPWDYLNNKNKSLEACSHEVVHPFFHCSPLQKLNRKWAEVFCQFLRGPLMCEIGLDGKEWWEGLIRNANDRTDSCRNPAGQLVLKFLEKNKSSQTKNIELITDRLTINNYVNYIFSNFEKQPFDGYLEPCEKMRK